MLMMLFAFGSNGKGQLGIGNTKDQDTPQRCIFQFGNDESPGALIKICSGGNHTLALFDSGRLFSAGSNDVGQAGPKTVLLNQSDPVDQSINFTEVFLEAKLQKIKTCSATWEASTVVTEDDEIYTFGNGPNGELGTGEDNSLQPQKLIGFPPRNSSIVDIASSVRHVIVVLSDGQVYGWGNGRKGQLGQSKQGIIRTPQLIEGLGFHAKQATCGREFSYIVGDPSSPDHKYLGTDKWNLQSGIPPKASSPSLCRKSLGSSWCGISILDTSGEILSWGRNDHGQTAPKNLPNIMHVAVGSEHTLALTESGQVLAWGWGEHGNCGPVLHQNDNLGKSWHESWNEIPLQPMSRDEKVQGIGAGCATSFIWTASDYNGD
ncbi:MAG: hypothetical protein HETSPECPRED_003940 [Heterodermia speciosa]|uniref:RCC1-like domain-containing protein n=1 Tax=Heterodermia speciosa TaxID=116794 RepID=A0A8H3F6J2_9LECA|nr:MAG: hypothetical protein HETSPECPRED_003940 [Heterodermia speciosa]